MRSIYADNAATTRVSRVSLAAMLPFLTQSCGNPSSLHTPGQEAAETLWHARETVARCIGASPREIVFTSGGSEADNQAILSAAAAGIKRKKTHIISTAFEHHAVLNTLKRLEREGFEVTLTRVAENGIVSPDDVRRAIRADTCLVSVMLANNEIGTVQPCAEIGALCRKLGVPFHTDAVQAVGHIPVDVRAIGADYLSASAHKFHGPKGVGFLYARKGAPLAPLISGGAQERGARAGTENVPGIVGMAAALEEAVDEMDETARRVTALRDRVIEGLSRIPQSVLNGDRARRLPGNVSFCFAGIDGAALVLYLDALGVFASAGAACSAGEAGGSHVLRAIGRNGSLAAGALRLSFSGDNAPEDADAVVATVTDAVTALRGIKNGDNFFN